MRLFIAHYCTLYARSDASELMETLVASLHGEVPQGPIPGTAYTISAPPPGGMLQALTKNGFFLVPGIGYTLNTTSITLAVPTVDGDQLWASWPVQVAQITAIPQTGAQIAAQGLFGGIQTSKSVGDVSVGYTPLALESWGAWNLTLYGVELATMANVVGSGPLLIR
jgi:hypothetical protein